MKLALHYDQLRRTQPGTVQRATQCFQMEKTAENNIEKFLELTGHIL